MSGDTAVDPCPCGSRLPASQCCGRWHDGAEPETAEQLMRARYSAWALLDASFLRRTWHPESAPPALTLDPELRWIGLKILATSAGGIDDELGTVEFVARCKRGGRAQRHHELSEFIRVGGAWRYVRGHIRDPGASPGPTSTIHGPRSD